jgi:hypothetical protein
MRRASRESRIATMTTTKVSPFNYSLETITTMLRRSLAVLSRVHSDIAKQSSPKHRAMHYSSTHALYKGIIESQEEKDVVAH